MGNKEKTNIIKSIRFPSELARDVSINAAILGISFSSYIKLMVIEEIDNPRGLSYSLKQLFELYFSSKSPNKKISLYVELDPMLVRDILLVKKNSETDISFFTSAIEKEISSRLIKMKDELCLEDVESVRQYLIDSLIRNSEE